MSLFTSLSPCLSVDHYLCPVKVAWQPPRVREAGDARDTINNDFGNGWECA